ncbi:MAG: S8 family serine peptidase [Bacteroidetes bacterium]|nr:S8 family serine peptidase [Bacteroidota bacterium]
MKFKLIILSLISLLTQITKAQDRYVILFSDKNNSPYSISNPSQFLSQRAIDRRNLQSISIDSSDLPVNPSYVQGVMNTGAQILNTSKWFNAVIIQTANPSVLAAINQLPYVVSTTTVGRIAAPSDNDPKFGKEQLMTKSTMRSSQTTSTSSLSYGFGYDQVNMLGLTQLHNAGYTGTGVLIAVLDAGFLDAPLMTCFNHLFTNNQIKYTWDFVDNETDVYDDHYHGAAVLSCIAAYVPDTLIGTAPDADFILLRSEDANSEYIIEEYNWSVAAEFADSAGADIINSSLGYTRFDDSTQNHFYADMNGDLNPSTIAADIAAKKGMVVLNSAGNEGASSWNYISAPADADSILSIGAVDQSGNYANFSSNGPTADGRVKPDVAAVGQGTWLYSPYSSNQAVQGNGTSFSSPVMAGAVACLWQAWPQKGNMDIIRVVKRSASQFSNPDTLLGYGIPNFSLANSFLDLEEYSIPSNIILHAFPNPWQGNTPLTLLYYASGGATKATMKIFDLTGRLTYENNFNVINGAYNQLQLTPELSNGCYIIEINDEFSVNSIKLIRL